MKKLKILFYFIIFSSFSFSDTIITVMNKKISDCKLLYSYNNKLIYLLDGEKNLSGVHLLKNLLVRITKKWI